MPPLLQCPASDQLEKYAAGKVSGIDSLRLRAHLVNCVECAEMVETFKSGPVSSSATVSDGESRVASAVNTSETTTDTRAAVAEAKSAEARDGDPLDFLRPPEADDELGRLGPYRVLSVLGEGGMGLVFRAEDTVLERTVALKVMKPGAADDDVLRKRFLQEGKAAAALQHDHVVTIYQVGEDHGVPFLALQFLEGEPLDAKLHREGRLTVEEVVRIGRETAEGLAAAHARGMVHRDIKPANIWLEDRGNGMPPRVKILDFGLARLDGNSKTHLTRTGVIMGTPDYMSPEQAKSLPVDARSDLFSLGCVIYHACSGRKPFLGDDLMSVLLSLTTEEPPSLLTQRRDVPEDLETIVRALMSKDPQRRPRSARDVAGLLEKVERQFSDVHELPTRAAIDVPSSPTPKPAAPAARLPASPTPPAMPAKRSRLEEMGLTPVDSAATEPAPTPARRRRETLRPDGKPEITKRSEQTLAELGTDQVQLDVALLLQKTDEGACPKCGNRQFSAIQPDWCMKCGWNPKEFKREVRQENVKADLDWLNTLYFGIFVVAGATWAVDYFFLTRDTARWTLWLWGQFFATWILFAVTHGWSYFLAWTYNDDTRTFVPLILSPGRQWRITFQMLPKSRGPVCLATWLLTSILALTYVAGSPLYWYFGFENAVLALGKQGKKKGGAKDGPNKEQKKYASLYVVGFVPGDEQTAQELVLAEQDGDHLLYRGRLPVTNLLDKDGKPIVVSLNQGAGLTLRKSTIEECPLSEEILVAGVEWVKPVVRCRVEYDSRDSKENLVNPRFLKLEEK